MAEEFVLTSEEVLHKKFMLAILKNIADTPLVLKGGTALLLAYGLDRFSEDLDFDSDKKLNLESKIAHSVRHGIEVKEIRTLKDTETVTRYRVSYETKHGTRSLKIEVSYRSSPDENDIEVIDGFRVYKVQKILDLKLLAAHDGEKPRTVIRDLFDIEFIFRKYSDTIPPDCLARLKEFASDPEDLVARYKQSYLEDDLVQDRVSLEDMALNLNYAVNGISSD